MSASASSLIASKPADAVTAAENAVEALATGRVDDAIRWLGDAREAAYAMKAAGRREKVDAALAADRPLSALDPTDPAAGAPVTLRSVPRGARPSKNGHGGTGSAA